MMELFLSAIIILITLNYAALILFFFMGWIKNQRKLSVNSTPDCKGVSIILPFKNEADVLPLILEELKNQELYGMECEVLLVNDGSSDDSVKLVNAFIEANDGEISFHLLHTHAGRSGKAEALHCGIQQARHSFVLTTDADCCLPGKWVLTMAQHWVEHKHVLLIGMVVPEKSRNILQKIFSLEFLSLTGSGGGAALMNQPFICNGANMGFSKALWQEYFDFSRFSGISHGDDVFLLHHALKLDKASVKFVPDKKSFVNTRMPQGLKSFIRQRIRWGSKTTAYTHFFSLYASLSIFLINALICALLAGAIVYHSILIWGLFAIGIKAMVDALLLWMSCKATDRLELMKWYAPFSFVYPFYLSITALLSLCVKVKWRA